MPNLASWNHSGAGGGLSTPVPGPLSKGPLLVAAAAAGPQLDLCAVGGAGAGDVQAQSGLDTGDGAVRVEGPLLVGAAVAGPGDHRCAVGGAPAGGVQAQRRAA